MTESVTLSPVIRLDPKDNVVVARVELAQDARIETEGLVTNHPVPTGHKIATQAIARGEPVLK